MCIRVDRSHHGKTLKQRVLQLFLEMLMLVLVNSYYSSFRHSRVVFYLFKLNLNSQLTCFIPLMKGMIIKHKKKLTNKMDINA